MPTAYIAFGGNLGEVLETFRKALSELQTAGLQLKACSSVYETAPVGGPPNQPNFLNAVVVVSTALSPSELLALLNHTEQRFGRRRDVHHGPRTLDLDLLFYDDLIIDQPGLQVPHPRLAERRFVLEPLAEIAPDLIHPQLAVTVEHHLQRQQNDIETIRQVAGSDWHAKS